MDISNLSPEDLNEIVLEASREELASMVLALYGAIKLKELLERV